MKYSDMNIISKIQLWMDSIQGQTFMNYAYSWGASVVILGTLFKLTHLSGANFFLFLGMGTEVFVFFISAFDRPFDKTAESREIEHDEIQTIVPSGTEKTIRTATDNAFDKGHLQFLNTRMAELEKMAGNLPDDEETDEIRNVLTAIHQVYQQQFVKLSSQLTSIDKMDELFKIQNAYLGELNKIYAKMLEAMGGPTAVTANSVKTEDVKV